MNYSIKLKMESHYAIKECILNMSIFYGITKMSCNDFLNAIKQNPNLTFSTIKDVEYMILKELKKEEQFSIDEYNSLNSYYGSNCVRAYKCPELKCDCKPESDRKSIETNPSNRVFRLYISNNKSELCNDNKNPNSNNSI